MEKSENFEDNEELKDIADEFEEISSDDLYSSNIRENLLDDDAISAEEECFMQGYDSA